MLAATTPRPFARFRLALAWLTMGVLTLAGLTGCGVTTLSSVATNDNMVDEPRLLGRWVGRNDRTTPVVWRISSKGRGVMAVVPEAGPDAAPGEALPPAFEARLADLGVVRILEFRANETEDEALRDRLGALYVRAFLPYRLRFGADGAPTLEALDPRWLEESLAADPGLIAAARAEPGDRYIITADPAATRAFFVRIGASDKAFASPITLAPYTPRPGGPPAGAAQTSPPREATPTPEPAPAPSPKQP